MRTRLPGWGALAVLAAAGCARPEPALVPGRTSVLLVILDTLRADHLGAWGYPHPTSPGLDRLAREGIVFEWTFSNCSWTRPSIGSLLTGLHPRTTGIEEEEFDRLPAELSTLAERFRAAGYLTLGLTANPNVDAKFGFDQGFQEYADAGGAWPWQQAGAQRAARPKATRHLDSATRVTDQTLAALDHHAEALARGPFYLQVLYVDPHDPYEAPEPFRAGLDSPSAAYDAEIRYVDAELTRLLDGLRARGLLEDTLVLVTSDHGEGLDSHGDLPRADKHGHTLFDSVTHVPLLLWHPRLAPARVPALTQLLDVAPTLAELFRLPAPDLPGSSLVPYFTDPGRASAHDVVVSETGWRYVAKLSLRTATHRYLRNDDAARFRRDGSYEGRNARTGVAPHLEALPDQELHARGPGAPFELPRRNDLLATLPELAADLERALETWERRHPPRPPENRSAEDALTLGDGTVVPTPGTVAPATMDPETLARLQALGYLGGE